MPSARSPNVFLPMTKKWLDLLAFSFHLFTIEKNGIVLDDVPQQPRSDPPETHHAILRRP